jgi:spore coat protein A, manganese oxidase
MARMTRRGFLVGTMGLGAALAVPRVFAAPAGKLAKYVQPVPLPGSGIVVATPRGGANSYAFTLRQISRQVHPDIPPTPIWAYDDGSGLAGQAGSFGMAVVAHSGIPVDATFTNLLPEHYPAWIPVDTRLTPLGDEVRAMAHLHGGFVSAASDGNPAVTPKGFGHGETQIVHYANDPEHNPATLLWFHDHGLGATRLNVFAGLAAAYILRDEFDTGGELNPVGLPGGAYEVPLVIQDRLLNADGTMLYPVSPIAGVTWVGEYFGDVMLVNGKVWPFLSVEPRMYRLRILNGCNARILNLDLGAAPMWQIGAEGGMWDRPVRVQYLDLAPAERADVLVDFSRLAGRTTVVKNFQPRGPVVSPAPPLTSVMEIRVGTTVTIPGPTSIPASLPGRAASLPEPVRTRYLTLNEVAPGTANWTLNINGVPFAETAGEDPVAGTVEDWVYVNTTEDTHPMHTHLVTHQVVDRTPFDAAAYVRAHGGPTGVPGGVDPTPFITGPAQPPTPGERGFKDTVKANPGYLTRIRARFDLPTGVSAPQTYVHHCHIVEHEDNEMMHPFTVRS